MPTASCWTAKSSAARQTNMKSDGNKNEALTTATAIGIAPATARDAINITTASIASVAHNESNGDDDDDDTDDKDDGDGDNDNDNDSCQLRPHDHQSIVVSSLSRSTSLPLGLALAVLANGKSSTSSSSMDYSQIVLIYRAEGNANLVLALPQFGKVLRLPKTSVDDTPKQHQNTSVSPKEEKQQQQIRFEGLKAVVGQHNELVSKAVLTMADYAGYIDVVRRLAGNEFILKAEIIEIARAEQRMWINETIRPFRPAQRLDKEFCGQFGLMLPDATLLPEALTAHSFQAATTPTPTPTPTSVRTSGNTYAIEIKPKQGWLLPNDVKDLLGKKLLQEQKEGKTTTTTTTATTASATTTPTTIFPVDYSLSKATARCRYCAMQYLKLKKREIGARSSYCPMDLFSGVPDRMWVALNALFKCPQNNLRIFQNGNLIYGDHSTSLSWNELKENILKDDMLQMVQLLVITCLLRNYETGGAEEAESVTAEGNGILTAREPKTITVSEAGTLAKKGTGKQKGVVEEAAGSIDAVPAQSYTNITVSAEQAKKSRRRQAEQKTNEQAEKEEEEQDRKKVNMTFAQERLQQRMRQQPEEIRTQCIEAELSSLPKNSVLHKILQLQLLAQQHLLYMANSILANNSTTVGEISASMKTYKTLADLLTRGAVTSSTELAPAQQYLLGATALDCSLMIAFQEVTGPAGIFHDPHLVHLTDYDKTFLTKVTILDLDPKPDQHFSKWFTQTAEAYQCSAESIYTKNC